MPFELALEKLKEQASEPPSKKKELDFNIISVVAFVEFWFWRHKGEIPTFEVISNQLGMKLKDVEKVWNDPTFRESLDKAGIHIGKLPVGTLTAAQLMTVNALVSIHDNMSLRQKLQGLGVTLRQYQTWLRDPVFQGYLRERAEFVFKVSDLEVKNSLVKAAAAGDVPAMKLYLEMTGNYSPKVQVDVNVTTIVYKMIEVITRHVKDPQIISAIAEDLDELVSPNASR